MGPGPCSKVAGRPESPWGGASGQNGKLCPPADVWPTVCDSDRLEPQGHRTSALVGEGLTLKAAVHPSPGPALKCGIAVSEFCVLPSCPRDPRATLGILDSFPLEKLIDKQSLRAVHRCDSELFKSCFPKNVIMVGTNAYSFGAWVFKQ